ncbi:hypothetical protein PGB90_004125 [Kerria lacca]
MQFFDLIISHKPGNVPELLLFYSSNCCRSTTGQYLGSSSIPADMPEPSNSTLATFAVDTALLSVSPEYDTAVSNLQLSLDNFFSWCQRWNIRINREKSINVIFTLRPHAYIPVYLNNAIVTSRPSVKYLGVHFDERLTFNVHIVKNRRELDLRLRNYLWLLRGKSELSLANKRLLYMAVIRPIWTYALPIRACTSNSNRNIIQRFQNKALCTITNAPWYVCNDVLHADLHIPTVVKIIRFLSVRHEKRLHSHPRTSSLLIF